jgi:hypothetical protein
MEFHSKCINHHEIQIKYSNKTIANTIELKFLRLILYNTMSWKGHTDMLTSRLNNLFIYLFHIHKSLHMI